MSKKFQRIGIIGRPELEDIETTLTNLYQFLQQRDLMISAETTTAQLIKNFSGARVDFQQLAKNQDLIIVVGGDGSMLRAANTVAQHGTPVIGINKGRLGFLTDISPDEIETRLAKVLEGEYWQAERFFLQICLDGKDCGIALNDIVLSPGKTPHMLEFEIYIDEEFVCSHHADGLIASTPTGSTAYSLSGGGPIVHPRVDAIVLLPMFPHTLSARPIVVAGNSEIRLELSANNRSGAQVSCDGGEIISMTANSHLAIKKYATALKLIHPMDYNYYQTLRSKLRWGQQL